MNAAWRGPILLAAGSAIIVAAIQFGASTMNHSPRSAFWLGGVVAGQIAVLGLWTSWSPLAAWKRAALALAYGAIPTYFVLSREWWFGGTLADGAIVYLLDALLLLVLTAILIPVRWRVGYSLTNERANDGHLKAGSFRLAELFGLTLVVAGALTILVPGGAGQIEARELLFQTALLGWATGSLLLFLFPCVRLVFSYRFSFLWLFVLLLYLVTVIVAAAEIFHRLLFLFKGSLGFGTFWEFRGPVYLVGTGFCMSLLPTLFLLRLAGFRLMIGSAGAGRMTACDTARC
jgi:hypothetical protein